MDFAKHPPFCCRRNICCRQVEVKSILTFRSSKDRMAFTIYPLDTTWCHIVHLEDATFMIWLWLSTAFW